MTESLDAHAPANRLTRQLVIVSLLAALVAGRQFMQPRTAWLMAAAFFVTAVVSLRSARAAAALVLGTALVAPALIVLANGFYYGPEAYVWLAALAALVTVGAWREPWALPPALRLPLVTWALVVACTWPVVVFREANFSPALMDADRRFAGALWIAASWIATVASGHMAGILWMDWLFRHVKDRAAFVRIVAAPLSVSWLLTIALGMYQAVVDITFLNGGAHLGLGRASGGLMDANPFGVIVALWGPVLYVLLSTHGGSRGRLAGMTALALSWYGMWVSGSRGAFGAAVIGVLVVVVAEAAASRRQRNWTLGSLGAAAVMAALLVRLAPPENSPIKRFGPLVNGITTLPLGAFLADRWDPYFYGRTAWRMVADSPLFGIGVGSFNSFVPGYSRHLGHPALLVDNAQNWFRHQFTEFGLIGSLGWAGWVACAAALLGSTARDMRTARIARGALLATAAVSLIGMPGQNLAFILAFWTLAYFLVLQVEPRWPPWFARLGRARLLPVAIALACAAGTAEVGWRRFMPVQRAAFFGDDYAQGVANAAGEGSTGRFGVPGRRALMVVKPTSRLVRISVRSDSPVHARVSVARRSVLDAEVGPDGRDGYVTVAGSEPGVVIDVSLDQVPASAPAVVTWEFLPEPAR